MTVITGIVPLQFLRGNNKATSIGSTNRTYKNGKEWLQWGGSTVKLSAWGLKNRPTQKRERCHHWAPQTGVFRGTSFARIQKVTWSPSARLPQSHQAAARLSPTRNAAVHSDRWRPPRSHSAEKLQLVHNLFSRVSMERQMSMQKFLMRNCDTFIVFTPRRRRSLVSRWWTTRCADRIEMCLFFIFFAPVIVLRF